MSRELYNGEPHANLHMAREGGCFYGEENELGRATIAESMAMAPHSSALAWKIPWMEGTSLILYNVFLYLIFVFYCLGYKLITKGMLPISLKYA